MKTELAVVIDVRDIEKELAARGIDDSECSVREAMFGTDYMNDCYKSYGLNWELEEMAEELVKMQEEDYYEDYYYSCAKLDYEIQKMLQEIFPNLDSVLVDVSW
jgi:hypothetical protein